MDAYRDLFQSIDVISRVTPNETLDSYTGNVQDRRLWSTSLYRKVTGDSRVRLCAYLEDVTHHLLAIIAVNEDMADECMKRIPALQRGLRQLIRNYDDMHFTDRVSVLIQALSDARIPANVKTMIETREYQRAKVYQVMNERLELIAIREYPLP